MNFKQATLLALLGSLLLLTIQIVYFFSSLSFEGKVFNFIPVYVMNLLSVIAHATVVVFFYILYTKQK